LAFIGSYAADKRVPVDELGYERADVVVASVLTGVIGVFVVVACAATLYGHPLARHREALAARPLAVFALGPRTLEPGDVAASQAQLDRALSAVGLVPDSVAIFGGVVQPDQLRFPFSRMPASDARDWRDQGMGHGARRTLHSDAGPHRMTSLRRSTDSDLPPGERSSADVPSPASMSPPVRVLLADRAGLAQRALAELLRGLDGVVLAEVAADREALAAALRRSHADVLVIDDRLLGNGGHVLDGLGLLMAEPRVLVLGVDIDPAFAERARRLGAEAWVPKDEADERLPGLLAR
jgi:CheY-like chemotaxis protein